MVSVKASCTTVPAPKLCNWKTPLPHKGKPHVGTEAETLQLKAFSTTVQNRICTTVSGVFGQLLQLNPYLYNSSRAETVQLDSAPLP